jgi:hypothetical protein
MEASKMESSKPSTLKIEPQQGLNSGSFYDSKKDASASSSDWIVKIRDQAEGMDQTLQSLIKKNPVVAMTVAAGVGLGASLVLKMLGSSGKLPREHS